TAGDSRWLRSKRGSACSLMGVFRSESHGGIWNSGSTAVLESNNITLVAISHAVSLYDRSLFLAVNRHPGGSGLPDRCDASDRDGRRQVRARSAAGDGIICLTRVIERRSVGRARSFDLKPARTQRVPSSRLCSSLTWFAPE